MKAVPIIITFLMLSLFCCMIGCKTKSATANKLSLTQLQSQQMGFNRKGQPAVSFTQLQTQQMDVIRKGQPPLPIPLTKEMNAQLAKEGVLPPKEN
jgi:hypothetical protein